MQGTPSGERWETYTVLEDSDTFVGETAGDTSCCGTTLDIEPRPTAPACR